HEYQAKGILRKYGVATARGVACISVDEAVKAACELGGKVWVVKEQIHAGGRGKGGGVKVAKSAEEVREWAGKILGMMLKTHQTGPEGQKVRRLLIEEGADIKKELYVGMVVDRGTQRVALMASSEGGMDIEEVAAHAPEKIHKVSIDPGTGLKDAEADGIAKKIGIPAASVPQARTIKVFLTVDRQQLYRRIEERFDRMLACGALDEVRALAARHLDPALPAMKAHGVPWLIRHLRGELGLMEAAEAGKRDTRRYTKRQATW